MLKVNFYDSVEDSKLKFAVIAARYKGKWLLCRHRERTTYEVPGGHREKGESIEETARRELFEESGAIGYTLKPALVYSVDDGKEESAGMLYFVEITELGSLPESEIAEVLFFDELPQNLTYPLIQPRLIEKLHELRFVSPE